MYRLVQPTTHVWLKSYGRLRLMEREVCQQFVSLILPYLVRKWGEITDCSFLTFDLRGIKSQYTERLY